ncbi:MAG TPA: CoA pyrophosphatase [Steroidobacteraceae bacterium]|jgi:8-oxo-dGTP pyrophosphatase MutT (NUDIX family)|nr:CoA pyrophosphatase [Steroidobacteraceae bacterium]
MAEAAASISPQLPADWRARLSRGLLTQPDVEQENVRLGGLASHSDSVRARVREAWPENMRAAAVLVGIVDRPEAPTLLMTVRARHLRQHPGQISFPGGRLEPFDADIAAAALRETHEEIGIAVGFIQPLGFLTDHVVQTGFRITPVVAMIRPGFTLNPDSTEVADVFELPLSLALAIESYRAQQRMVRDFKVDVWELPFGEYHIWGATAGILMNLCEVVSRAHA